MSAAREEPITLLNFKKIINEARVKLNAELKLGKTELKYNEILFAYGLFCQICESLIFQKNQTDSTKIKFENIINDLKERIKSGYKNKAGKDELIKYLLKKFIKLEKHLTIQTIRNKLTELQNEITSEQSKSMKKGGDPKVSKEKNRIIADLAKLEDQIQKTELQSRLNNELLTIQGLTKQIKTNGFAPVIGNLKPQRRFDRALERKKGQVLDIPPSHKRQKIVFGGQQGGLLSIQERRLASSGMKYNEAPFLDADQQEPASHQKNQPSVDLPGTVHQRKNSGVQVRESKIGHKKNNSSIASIGGILHQRNGSVSLMRQKLQHKLKQNSSSHESIPGMMHQRADSSSNSPMSSVKIQKRNISISDPQVSSIFRDLHIRGKSCLPTLDELNKNVVKLNPKN